MSFLKEVIQLYVERKDWFLELIAAHIGLSLVAILCAGSIGLLLGIWISEHEKAAGPVLGVANVFYTIPSISLLGMLIPFLGIGNTTAVAALTIYGIMPMVRNTYAGIKGVSEEIILAAEAMGSTRMQIMWKIKLPLAMGRCQKYGRNDNFCCGHRIVYRSRWSGGCDLQRNYDL